MGSNAESLSGADSLEIHLGKLQHCRGSALENPASFSETFGIFGLHRWAVVAIGSFRGTIFFFKVPDPGQGWG